MNITDLMNAQDGLTKPAKLELKAANGEPLLNKAGEPITLSLYGRDSAVFIETTQKTTDAYLRGRRRTVAGLEDDDIRLLTACTADWSGITDDDGKPLKCEPETVAKLYRSVRFIREQVDAFIGNRANYAEAA